MQRGGEEIWLYSFFNLGARRGGWLMPNPGSFTLENDLKPIVYEDMWNAQPKL
jgi:hypothetical protein